MGMGKGGGISYEGPYPYSLSPKILNTLFLTFTYLFYLIIMGLLVTGIILLEPFLAVMTLLTSGGRYPSRDQALSSQ